MKHLIFCILMSFSILPCLGQTSNSKGQIYDKKADSLISVKSLDSANFYLDLAAKTLLEEKDTLGYFHSRNKKSVVVYDQVNYDSSMLIAQLALEQMREMQFQNGLLSAEFHRRIGVIYEVRDGNFQKAIEFYKGGVEYLNGMTDKYFIESQLQKDISIAILSQGYIDSAQVVLKKAILFLEESFPLEYGELSDSYRILAITYTYLSDTEQAVYHYHKSLKVLQLDAKTYKRQQAEADIYGNLAATYQRNGYYDSASHYYYKQKTLNEEILDKDHRNLSFLYGNLSLLKVIKGDLDSAYYYTEKDLKITERTLSENHPDLAFTYSKASSILVQLDRYEEAQAYAEKALAILENSFGNSHPQTFDPLFQLANLHLAMRQNNISLDYYRRALEVHQSGESSLNQPIVAVHLGIADNHLDLGDLDLAMKAAQKGYQVVLREYDATHELAARAKLRFGEYYRKKGNYSQAILELKQAQKIFLKHHGTRNHMVSETILNMAEIRKEMGLGQDALTLFQESVLANSYSFDSRIIGENPALSDMINPAHGINIMIQMAGAMTTEFQKTKDKSWLLLGNKQYKTSVDLLAELIFETSMESDAMRMLDRFHESYSGLLNTLTQMKDYELIEPKTYKQEILKYSEESRNINLAFNQYKASKSNLVPLLELDSLKLLNREISFVKSELLTAKKNDADSIKVDYYEKKLFELTNTKNIFKANSESTSWSYLDFKREREFQTLNQYQQELSPNEGIIEYFIADSTLFSIVITDEKLDVISQKLEHSLSDQIADYLSFKSNDMDRYLSGAYDLYKTLIHPLESSIEGLDKLIILPEKQLWNVNFDLLIDKEPLSKDPVGFDYLIRKYRVSYASSLDALFKETEKGRTGQMLAFAYEEGEENLNEIFTFRSDNKSKISGTISEVKSFDRDFEGDFYYGQKATEHIFKQKSQNYSILHLALHGDIDDTELNASHLIFNQAEEDSLQDGYLYPFELYDLELNAELVVLSACHTGAGEIINGEGVMSIGRGFLYAGVNSLLLSQWEVSDATAPKIITRFYRYLSEGYEKDQALRLSKLDFLETANNITANPHYWGSFFILGDTSSINLKKSFNWSLWLSIVAIFSVIGLAIRKQALIRRKSLN